MTAGNFGEHAMEDNIQITVFTDPMMGLSYESEPILDALTDRYGDRLEIRYVMSVLVRDVNDFMTPAELALPPEEGIPLYCKRLARIYKRKEHLGGLPINMDDFRLFDPEHRSSRPLCLAYKAAQLADYEKADRFLLSLRRATILNARPTTHQSEILAVARSTGIDEESFLSAYRDGRAEDALERDLAFGQSLGIRTLPAYFIRRHEKGALLQSFDVHDFISLIDDVL